MNLIFQDFGDGGAFPECHVAQYPLGMGMDTDKGGGGDSNKTLAVQLDEKGKVKYDVIARQGHSKDKVSFSITKNGIVFIKAVSYWQFISNNYFYYFLDTENEFCLLFGSIYFLLKIVYSKLTDLLPTAITSEDDPELLKPSSEEVNDVTEKTRQALEKLTQVIIDLDTKS